MASLSSLDGSRLICLELGTGDELRILVKQSGSRVLLASSAGPLPQDAALLSLLSAYGVRAIERRGFMSAPPPSSSRLECVLCRCGSVSGATRLATLPLTDRPSTSQHGDGLRGFRAWLSAAESAASVDTRGLQARVDAAVATLDESLAAAASEKETLRAKMLADGFTLVTRKTTLESEEDAGSSKKKKRGRVGEESSGAFYTFQKQDEKLKRLEALRQGFAEDKLTIERIKTQRKFKPF